MTLTRATRPPLPEPTSSQPDPYPSQPANHPYPSRPPANDPYPSREPASVVRAGPMLQRTKHACAEHCSLRGSTKLFTWNPPPLQPWKLLRSGWTISQSDGGPCLQYDDSSIPISFKLNSLLTDARICTITEQVETPMDAENIKIKDMNRVELTSVLERIGESWDQIDVHCFAKKSVGRRYISVAADSPEEGLCYRTTLVRTGR